MRPSSRWDSWYSADADSLTATLPTTERFCAPGAHERARIRAPKVRSRGGRAGGGAIATVEVTSTEASIAPHIVVLNMLEDGHKHLLSAAMNHTLGAQSARFISKTRQDVGYLPGSTSN